jgi:NAD(P)-dependent dehydrogenase (short-subunit alcohol dehydrogenase family)
MLGIDLQGHRALVTGAARGIGRATALLLARAGADLCLTVHEHDVAAVAAEAEALGRSVRTLPLDLVHLRRRDAEKLGEWLADVDIVVANAAVMGLYGVLEQGEEDLLRVLQVNVAAHLWLIQASLPTMRARGWGRVVVIGSSLSAQGEAAASVDYNMSKAALQTLAKTLAQQFGRFGITANAVAPGIIDTPMHADWPELVQGFVPEIPVGRLGTPEDVAAAVVFLASPWAAFINGQVLHVNGGQRPAG